jgi:hypothetical protein
MNNVMIEIRIHEIDVVLLVLMNDYLQAVKIDEYEIEQRILQH